MIEDPFKFTERVLLNNWIAAFILEIH